MDNFDDTNERVKKALEALVDAEDWIADAGDNCGNHDMDEWFTEVYGMIETVASDIRAGMKRWKEEVA